MLDLNPMRCSGSSLVEAGWSCSGFFFHENKTKKNSAECPVWFLFPFPYFWNWMRIKKHLIQNVKYIVQVKASGHDGNSYLLGCKCGIKCVCTIFRGDRPVHGCALDWRPEGTAGIARLAQRLRKGMNGRNMQVHGLPVPGRGWRQDPAFGTDPNLSLHPRRPWFGHSELCHQFRQHSSG